MEQAFLSVAISLRKGNATYGATLRMIVRDLLRYQLEAT